MTTLKRPTSIDVKSLHNNNSGHQQNNRAGGAADESDALLHSNGGSGGVLDSIDDDQIKFADENGVDEEVGQRKSQTTQM